MGKQKQKQKQNKSRTCERATKLPMLYVWKLIAYFKIQTVEIDACHAQIWGRGILSMKILLVFVATVRRVRCVYKKMRFFKKKFNVTAICDQMKGGRASKKSNQITQKL
ncbi:MAG: hypothetical protein ACI90V_013593 [Bacillariaceae sp.]|jgi:hypothetical protein